MYEKNMLMKVNVYHIASKLPREYDESIRQYESVMMPCREHPSL